MLQTVLGPDAERIASIYLVSPGMIAQRLTRAKAKIDQPGISLDLPDAEDEYPARLDDILASIYAACAIGANGLGSGDQKASNLAGEALWLIGAILQRCPRRRRLMASSRSSSTPKAEGRRAYPRMARLCPCGRRIRRCGMPRPCPMRARRSAMPSGISASGDSSWRPRSKPSTWRGGSPDKPIGQSCGASIKASYRSARRSAP